MVTNHLALVKAVGPSTQVGFADNGGNTTVTIETAAGEKHGRVAELLDGDEDGSAPDLDAFLARIAGQLERGDLIWSVEAGAFETPEDIAQGERLLARAHAMEDAPTLRQVYDLKEGGEIELIGARTDAGHRDRYTLAIPGGKVDLVGSLAGSDRYQTLRVRVRVGRSRLLGLAAPLYHILSWEPIDTPS